MSIETEIGFLLNGGQLRELTPAMPGNSFTRAMLLSAEIFDLVTTHTQNKDRARRCGQLRADFEAFALGNVINVCLTPFRAGTAYMGRLDPPADGIFDIRSVDPSPALRVLGGFILRDTFVALTWAPRSRKLSWSKKKPLGARNSREWRAAIKRTKKQWRMLFPNNPPIPGGRIHDIISTDAVLI